MKTIGLLPLGRPTFDVPYAEQQLAGMLACLDKLDYKVVGPRELLFDTDSTVAAMGALQKHSPDVVLILQVTFTDASMAVEAANRFLNPLVIWAVPEPRVGGRLRLNAFCGLNLASHALGLANRDFDYLFVSPENNTAPEQLNSVLSAENITHGSPLIGVAGQHEVNEQTGLDIRKKMHGMKVARIGEHPEGFATCAYDADKAFELTGIKVDALHLDKLFDRARNASESETGEVFKQVQANLLELDQVDQQQLDASLKLKVALDQIRDQGEYDAFAIRCWPETFTEYGGAVCGPVSLLGEARVPCACEADVYGAITQLMLQESADAPVFLVDLVDIDIADNSSVVWHCGQAPVSMANPKPAPKATVHTNRVMPLLYEFTLKPGRVTFARLSQARGVTQLIIGGGEMLERDMAFTGTSGVVRFDCEASELLPKVIRSGLEHHMGLVYGDHRDALRAAAAALDIPLLEL